MNISYNGLKLEDYSEQVQQRYAFPNNSQLQRYVHNDPNLTNGAKEIARQHANNDILTIAGGLIVGTVSYVFFNAYAGKVIRDRVRASWSFPKRLLALGLPFAGFGVALALSRKGLESPLTYVE